MHANINVSEPKPPDDPESPLSFSMEGVSEQPPPALIPFFWSPGWNSIQAVNKFQQEIAGPLRGGDPGVRLIAPSQDGTAAFGGDVPASFEPRQDERLLIPLYHIFGSDELSHWAPAITELTPKPYIAMNADEAARLRLQENDEVSVTLDGFPQKLSVRIRPGMPAGVAGLPSGLPGMPYWNLPAWARISK